LVHISLEPGNSPVIDLKQHYANATAADDAEKAMKDALVMVKQMLAMHRKEAEASLMGKSDGNRSTLEEIPEAAAALAALGLINKAEEILKDFPTKREGNALATRVTIPEGPVGRAVSTMGLAAGFLLPAVQKVREAAARTQSQNNLKQLNLAVINYETTFNALPPAAICDKQGKPLLSWRVAVLPYVEQSALYREFHLDEPWDSEHNIKLIHKFPRVFANPLVPLTGREEYPTTNYLALVGNGAGWELKGGLKFPASFPDGTSNTIWLVEAEKGVPWTKPEDISYDPKKMPPLGFFAGGRCNVGFADGSVRALSRQVPERTWHLLIQRNDGQPIPAEDLDK
jgi:prepilin-type processing-associated H-X9-DG protein